LGVRFSLKRKKEKKSGKHQNTQKSDTKISQAALWISIVSFVGRGFLFFPLAALIVLKSWEMNL
jgi:hypothetical protein